MVSYHPDFHRKNVGELGKEVRLIIQSKRYDPFAKFLGSIMEKGMWSRIKEISGDVEPAKLLKLFRAYRAGELKKHIVTVKTYHSGEGRLREETLTMEEYLRRLSSTVRSPHCTAVEKLSEIVQNLHVLAEAIEREECKEGCNITVSPYPEFFYDEKEGQLYYISSATLSVLGKIEIGPTKIRKLAKSSPSNTKPKKKEKIKARTTVKIKLVDSVTKLLEKVLEKEELLNLLSERAGIKKEDLLRFYKWYTSGGKPKKVVVEANVYNYHTKQTRRELFDLSEFVENVIRRVDVRAQREGTLSYHRLVELLNLLSSIPDVAKSAEEEDFVVRSFSEYPDFLEYEKNGKKRLLYLPAIRLSFYESIGLPWEKLKEVNLDTLIPFLKLDHNKILDRIRFYESLGLPKDYVLRAGPSIALPFLALDPETVRRRLKKLAKQLGVTVKDLPKIYAPNTLLIYVMRKEVEPPTHSV